MTVSEYIRLNWKNTIRKPKDMKGGFTPPKPFISPSIGGLYTDLYYWDVYFTNLGLLEDGLMEQVENNLENIAYFINELGFMPNSNLILDRSQPPFFCRAVYDYYKASKDERVVLKFVDAIIKEYEFWQTKRKDGFGLNRYFTNGDDELKRIHYESFSKRVAEVGSNGFEKIQIGENIMAIAESGLDFNPRFKTEKSKINSTEFVQLDINCILYDVEIKLAEMLGVVGRKEDGEMYNRKAEIRKGLINEYLYNKEESIYQDYNFKKKKFSSIVSAVSLYPYAFGVSTDKGGAEKVLKILEMEHGVSVCPYRGEDWYFQWDYPFVWAPISYLSYVAMKNVGLVADAKRIAEKYVKTIEDNFKTTGRLWEKYNAKTGKVGVSVEYKTPEMLGWTAGVYRYFINK